MCKTSRQIKVSIVFNRRQNAENKYGKSPKKVSDYPQTIDYNYGILKDCIATKKRKVLIVFYDMIADIEVRKNLKVIVAEMFMRERKLNISFFFVS